MCDGWSIATWLGRWKTSTRGAACLRSSRRWCIALSIVPGLLADLAIVYAIRHSPRSRTARPPTAAPAEGLAFAPGDPVIDNVRRFGVYTLLTSTGSFDTGRAITRPVVLTTLGRAARKVRIDTRC